MKNQNVYVVVESGQGDVYYTILNASQFKGWPNDMDSIQYFNTLSKADKEWDKDVSFSSIKDLIRYIVKNNLNVVGEASGYIY